VGQSHPFNIATGTEVLPQEPGPPPRTPTHVSVWVHVIHRCNFVPHVRFNGEAAVGGNMAVALYRVGRHNHLTRLFTETGAAEDSFTEGEGYRAGTYRLAVRFLGDENLLPSSKSASVVFHLARC